MIPPHKKPWVFVALWILCIYATIPMARPVTDFLKKILPFGLLINLLALMLLACALVLIARHVTFQKLSTLLSAVFLVCSYGVMLSAIKIPDEKIHFIEYSVLSFLMFFALQKTQSDWRCYFISFFLTSLVGWGDEGLQHLTPGRYYDFRDVVFNAIGGMLGLLFVFILKNGGREDLKPFKPRF